MEESGPKILIHFTHVIEPKPYFVPCKEVGCPPMCEMGNVIALGTKAPKTLIELTFFACVPPRATLSSYVLLSHTLS